MEEYKCVELTEDLADLALRGILKGCKGIALTRIVNTSEWLVFFMNSRNYGDYATAAVNCKYLKVLGDWPVDFQNELKSFAEKNDILNRNSFTLSTVKEYDLVELIQEKEAYAKHGVHKGMSGCVMSAYAIKGKWSVIFTEDGTGKDIADIMVDEKDFIVIK